MVAEALRREGDYETAERLVERAVQKIPYSSRAVEYLANLYDRQGQTDKLRALVERTTYGDRRKLKVLLGYAEQKLKRYAEAEQLFSEVLTADESYRPALKGLVKLYFETNQAVPMRLVLQRWVQHNPDDSQVKRTLEELQKRMAAPDTIGQGQS